MKTLQKDGRTLTKEEIFLDLSKLSEGKQNNVIRVIQDSDDDYYEDFSINDIYNLVHYDNDDGKWIIEGKTFDGKTEITYPDFLSLFRESELTELPPYTEITVADYKRLSGSAENAHTENPVSSKMETTENPTRAENAQVGTCKENLQVDSVNDLAGMPELSEEETKQLIIENYKYHLENCGYFVFPKAPEGEFPDLSGFEGPLMNVYDGDGEERDLRVIAKYTDDSLGYHFISEVIEHWKYVRPIQKQITPTELFERLSKYEDLSNYEKPV